MNKVIIFSAPSGAGKSTIVNHILKLHPEMEFSISATSRAPRGSEKNGVEYVRWDTVNRYMEEIGFPNKLGKEDFIPENIFYRLAMKAKNEAAEKFQATIADKVIPSIRKHGAYMTPETLKAAILNPDTMIQLCTALKEEQDKNKALQAANSALEVEVAISKPKADYFDELVDRNLLTSFRETSKQLQVKEKVFVQILGHHQDRPQ